MSERYVKLSAIALGKSDDTASRAVVIRKAEAGAAAKVRVRQHTTNGHRLQYRHHDARNAATRRICTRRILMQAFMPTMRRSDASEQP